MGKKVSAAAAAAKEEAERRDEGGQRLSPSSSSSSSSSSGSSPSSSDSQTLSEEGEAGSATPPASRGAFQRADPHRRDGTSEPQRPGGEAPGGPATLPSVAPRAGKEGGEVEKEGCVDGRQESEEEEDDSGSPGGLDGCGGARPRPETDASLEEQDEELDSILSPPPMPFRKSSNPEVSSGPGKSLKFKRQLSEDGRPFRRGSLGGALTGRYLLPNAVTQHSWQTGETSNLVRMRTQALGQSAPSLTASLEGIPPKSHFSSIRHRQQLVEPAATKNSNGNLLK
ncbi:PREDICTED: microtubule-associated serine/threonine-protein kinase 4-like [Thamnophis sirtalis]|uniref:Microtubule-associated serine/threonine-protein kinase 4-like n=1 Tax=Thamnophis sirtalis TaxID=35019 RepID=A0A6I9Y4Q5_9SAUR|nr:PREDICTED: microtubule-associated serine/threonine-protein kinase 4-like [Thamnophis sirtalis]